MPRCKPKPIDTSDVLLPTELMSLTELLAENAHDRRQQPTCSGNYVIGKGSPAKVVYIGRTTGGGGLRTRLRAFNRSAVTGRSGHAGGVTYHCMFGGQVEDLHVRVHSAFAAITEPNILKPYISYAERRLVWEHVAKHGDLPACNSE